MRLGNEDQRRDTGRGRVRGQRGGGVAGRGAGDDASADRLGVAHADGHPPVLERGGGIVPLVLELEVAVRETGVARQAIVTVERGVALPAADERGFGEGRQERQVPPDAGVPGRGGDTYADVGRRQLAPGGDDDVEEAAAGGALVSAFAPVKRASQAMQRTTIRSSISASVVPESAESGRSLPPRSSPVIPWMQRVAAPRNAIQTGRIPPFAMS